MADLGLQPLANNYLRSVSDIPAEKSYPLVARVCRSCHLAQVDKLVEPAEIFSDYAYFSSVSSSWVAHASGYAELMQGRFQIDQNSLVVEVASNDGYLLQHFIAKDIPVLGIEPAANIADYANAKGIRTVNVFMGVKTAGDLVKQGHADLVAANNVLAHVPDLNDFIGGLRIMLKPTGVLTVEFHHLLNLIQCHQFDTIYHEHFSYLSLSVVQRMFAAHDLKVFDVEELSTHGGSLRVYAHPASGPTRSVSAEVARILGLEQAARLDEEDGYRDFHLDVIKIRDGLINFVNEAKASNRSIVAYGAAAKGNTLLNYCRLDKNSIDYVVDNNPSKQGRLLPGSHIPIVGAERLYATKPDYVLILPWNIAPEITEQQSSIGDWGGHFVVAVPRMTVLS